MGVAPVGVALVQVQKVPEGQERAETHSFNVSLENVHYNMDNFVTFKPRVG